MRTYSKLSLAVLASAIVIAIAVDRVSYYLWEWRIIAFHEKLNNSSKMFVHDNCVESDDIVLRFRETEKEKIIATVKMYGPRPSYIVAGGLPVFVYHPPLLAWSQYLQLVKYRHNKEEYEWQLFYRSYRLAITADLKDGSPRPGSFLENGRPP